MTLEDDLRQALAALRRAREVLPMAGAPAVRVTVEHELARAEGSVGRVLHLIAGAQPVEEQTPCSG